MQFLIAVFIGFFGWLAGSLLNFLADQLPYDGKLSTPVCNQCATTIRWIDYLFLRKCKKCSNGRSLRSWILQFGLAAIWIAIYIYPGDRLPYWAMMVLVAYFWLVSMIDIEHRIILGPLSITGCVLGAVIGIYLHGILLTLLGGVAGAAIMGLVYLAGRMYSRWMAKKHGDEVDKEALGFGDVYIAAIIGLILGWPGVSAALFLAILIGGVVSGLVLLGMFLSKRYRPFQALPYAPFLLISAFILLIV